MPADAERRLDETEESQKEKEIADPNAVISRKKHFDKYFLFQNIRELIKGTEIKLGQIEREAGCQPGYMSRLEKTDSATDPTAEFIITAAQMLNVSVDVLLKVRVSELTSNERLICSFLEKMIRDTIADRLKWNLETESTLKTVTVDQDGISKHPLFVTAEYDRQAGSEEHPKGMKRIFFPSRTFEDETVIHGDCFHIRLQNGALFYLMDICKGEDALSSNEDAYAIEAWMYLPQAGASCLCSTQDHIFISELVTALYKVAAQNAKHPKIRKEFRDAMNAYLKDDQAASSVHYGVYSSRIKEVEVHGP